MKILQEENVNFYKENVLYTIFILLDTSKMNIMQ